MAIRIRDDRNRELLFFHPPRRVVSLVPSDTLTLFALGAGDRLVGRTSYCVEPAGQVEEIAACGGTKDTDVEAVLALAPDLVLANQEENSRRPLEELARRGAPVLVSFPRRVAEGVAHVARLARILGVEREPAARALLRAGYEALRAAEAAAVVEPVEVFVPIWMDPLMTFSDGTFASDLLAACGARNVFGDRARRYPLAADLGRAPALGPERVGERDTRYPRVTLDEVVARDPALVLLPDEPHEFTEADAEVFRRALPRSTVRFVDGKDLFWHGARTVEALGRLRALLSE